MHHRQFSMPLSPATLDNYSVIIIEMDIIKKLLKVCYVPATSATSSKAFLLRPFTILMRQTRQVVHAIKRSIYLVVYGYK
jgi:hypothetical protein